LKRVHKFDKKSELPFEEECSNVDGLTREGKIIESVKRFEFHVKKM
jgi:hypothetical protein